jgi:hypothetical protein
MGLIFATLKGQNMHLSSCFISLNRRSRIAAFVTAALFIAAAHSTAFSADTTAIVIVGTVHNKTDNFSVKNLQEILERVKPDLILVELDSSFLTPSMSIKPEFARISLENEAVAEYQKKYKTPIRPYDIEGRNKIYESHNYFKLQKDLSNALNKAVRDSLLRGESATLFDAIQRFDEIGRSCGLEPPGLINSDACDAAMDSKQYYAGEGMVKIVEAVPALKQFEEFAAFKRDFWIRRNEAMVTNILFWTGQLHPKTILVLCGFEHRYYLRNALAASHSSVATVVREYRTY